MKDQKVKKSKSQKVEEVKKLKSMNSAGIMVFRSPSGLSEAKTVSRGAEGSSKLDA